LLVLLVKRSARAGLRRRPAETRARQPIRGALRLRQRGRITDQGVDRRAELRVPGAAVPARQHGEPAVELCAEAGTEVCFGGDAVEAHVARGTTGDQLPTQAQRQRTMAITDVGGL